MLVAGLLAVLSASAAAGMRIALPLLILGLLRSDELWSNVPVLSNFDPKVVLTVLTSWSLFELFGSKSLLGQRTLQAIELVFSPFVGALMGITVVNITRLEIPPIWLIGLVGGLLALVLKLVQVGWFFRLRGLPIWMVCLEDVLCICLVFFALKAPEQGGLIAIFLLWLAVRSSQEWRRWYLEKKKLPIDR
ncbi:MAG: DUF4126 domain-containing protein [Hydrococcus sp. C42_A2020_068]|uniref:DUF4126 domain-containing protein n=1 Tax=Pleurocapsa sp. PCC 7327 TaxID=118163 RepID=UPI00029F89FF|nr:DUF4126 domain-containing protein [Pleurocapsa sp. PCC 7327]AFY76375.1 hypothetical protein Ple7327_0953 [Pleurocapsa sp. PCC 7327]MBF2018821.1 DUF4126 domain-containing protein [Hydrococcus sp. C42_A2020_068]